MMTIIEKMAMAVTAVVKPKLDTSAPVGTPAA